MPDKRECPNCRALIDARDAVCPICDERLEPISVEEPGAEITCRTCGSILDASLTICPICGEGLLPAPSEPIAPSEGERECHVCGTILPADAQVCPVCETAIEVVEAPAAPAEPVEEWDLGVVGKPEKPKEELPPIEEKPVEGEPEAPEEIPPIEGKPEEPVEKEREAPEEIPKIEEKPEELPPSEEERREEIPPTEIAPEEAPVALKENEYLCPSCGAVVRDGDVKCASCWADLTKYHRCPSCGTLAPIEITVCPECFTAFPKEVPEAEEAPAVIEVEEAPEVPFEAPPSMVCPYCGAPVSEEDVICTDCGMVLIEEEEEEEEAPPELRRPRIPPAYGKWEKRAVILVVCILLFSAMLPFIFPLPPVERDRIVIDGTFEDWAAVTSYEDPSELAANPSVDIRTYQVASDARNIYFSVSVAGTAFGSSQGETMRVFIDTDLNPNTGYSIRGIGADYMVRAFGWGGIARSASLLRYSSQNPHDFNAFVSHGQAVPYAAGAQTEVRVKLIEMELDPEDIVNVLFYMGNSIGIQDYSEHIVSNREGVLNVRQTSLVPADGILPQGASMSLLQLEMIAVGARIDVTSIDTDLAFNRSLPITVLPDVPQILLLNLSTAGMVQGTLVNESLTDVDFEVSGGSVVVTGVPARAYVGAAPYRVEVDGAFADWYDEPLVSDALGDVMARDGSGMINAPSLDITRYGVSSDASALCVYVQVGGVAMRGSDIPVTEDAHVIPQVQQGTRSAEPAQHPERGASSNGSARIVQPDIRTRQQLRELHPPAPKEKTGEDAVLVFVDRDNSSATGYLVGEMGADRLIEVKGRNGIVTSVRVLEHDSADQRMYAWREIANATGMSTGSEVEATASLTSLALENDAALLIHVVNWREDRDASDENMYTQAQRRLGTRQGGPVLVKGYVLSANGTPGVASATVIINIEGPDPTIVTNSTNATATPGYYYAGDFELYANKWAGFYATDGTMWGWNRTQIPSGGGVPVIKRVNITLNKTLGAEAPRNLTVGVIGGSTPKFNLTWNSSSAPAGGFTIYRTDYNQFTDGYSLMFNTSLATTANNYYIDEDLVRGKRYWYYIAANDGTMEIYNSTFMGMTAVALPSDPLNVFGRTFYYTPFNGTTSRLPGAGVRLETYNITGALYTWSGTTDLAANYIHTLQPNNYSDGGTVWVNASMGDLRGFNSTITFQVDGAVPCNVVLVPANITVNKTVDLDLAVPGDTLTYTIWVNNSDTWNATVVWVNDTLPDGTRYVSDTNATAVLGGWASSASYSRSGNECYWTFYNVTPGAHFFELRVMVNSTYGDGSYIENGDVLTNWAFCNYSAMANETIWVKGNPTSDFANTSILVSNVTVAKVVDLLYANPGDFLNYTIWFNNTGAINASWVWVNDTLPAGVTYWDDNASSLSCYVSSTPWTTPLVYIFREVPTGNWSFYITVRVNTGVINGTWVNNTVTGNYTMDGEHMPETWDEADTWVITPNITVVKTVDMAQARPGDYLTYTIYFNNTGADIADWVWINDTLDIDEYHVIDTADSAPTAFPFFYGSSVSAVPGATLRYVFRNVTMGAHSFTITAQVLPEATVPGWVNNTARLDYATNYTTYPPSTDLASTTLIAPNVTVWKEVNQTQAAPGDPLTYAIIFNNSGTANASYIWINDSLPAGVTYIGDDANALLPYFVSSSLIGTALSFVFREVPPGNYSFNISVTILSTVQNGTWLNNTVRCNFAPSGIETSDTVSTLVIRPIVDVNKTVAPGQVYPGGFLNYTVWFNNTGGANASYVWLNDTLPDKAVYISDTNASLAGFVGGIIWTRNGRYLNLTFINVPPGIYSFTIMVRVYDGTALPGDIVLNSVNCEYKQENGLSFEPSTASAIAVVLPGPAIVVTKTPDHDPVLPGDILTYQITFDNLGDQNASIVWINDTLPAGVEYISDTNASVVGVSPGTNWSHIGNSLRWIFYNVTPSPPSHTFLVRVRVINETDGARLPDHVECEYISDTGIKGPWTEAWANVTVVRPIVEISKIVDRAVAAPGDLLTYTIWFNNSGSAPGIVNITDTLPIGVSYVGFVDGGAHVLMNWGNSSQYLWFNFTGVQPGSHWVEITCQINENVTSGTVLVNLAEMN
ncbi:MAG: zinc ribbon domain-containing protein, partial [Candidatus Thermoplasmatota archaeon]